MGEMVGENLTSKDNGVAGLASDSSSSSSQLPRCVVAGPNILNVFCVAGQREPIRIVEVHISLLEPVTRKSLTFFSFFASLLSPPAILLTCTVSRLLTQHYCTCCHQLDIPFV